MADRWRPFKLALTIAAVALTFAFALSELWRFVHWPSPVYLSPEILNLETEGVTWDLHHGPAEVCGQSDCHLLPTTPAERFNGGSVKLPSHAFRVPGWQPGEFIYYRTSISLPARLLAGSDPLVFHSLYIWARRFEFYAGGRLVDTGGSRQLEVTLPRHLLSADGRLDLAVKVDPGSLEFQGLAHWGGIAIGPAAALAPLRNMAHDLKTTFYLWFLLPKLALCLLCAFLYLFVAAGRENFPLLVYGLLGAVKMLLFTAYADAWLPSTIHGAAWAGLVDWYVQLALATFTLRFFRVSWRMALPAFAVFGALPFLAWLAATAGLWAGDPLLAVYDGARWLRLLAIMAGIGAGVTALRGLRQRQPHARRRSCLTVTVFLGAYLVLAVCDQLGLTPPHLVGIVEYTFELLMFVVFAAVVAMEYAAVIAGREAERQRRERTEEDARVAHAVARLTRMLAHDVRRPFAMMKVLLQAVRSRLEPGRGRELVDSLGPELERQTADVEGMLGDIMAIGTAMPLARTTVVVRQLVAEAMRLALAQRARSGVGLTYELEPRLTVEADPVKLRRVLVNLMDNAIEATPVGGTVTVRARALAVMPADARRESAGVGIEISVHNTGSYLTPPERDAVFDLFYSRGKPEGTGLGLAYARQAARAHGGDIDCRSDVDRGTEFILRLPAGGRDGDEAVDRAAVLPAALTGDVDAVPVATPGAQAAAGRPALVVVDDNVFFRQAWVNGVPDADVIPVTGPEELRVRIGAILAARPGAGALMVVTDQIFGGAAGSGADLAELVSRMAPDVPVFVSSHLTAAELPGFAAWQILEKRPYSWHELRELARGRPAAGR